MGGVLAVAAVSQPPYTVSLPVLAIRSLSGLEYSLGTIRYYSSVSLDDLGSVHGRSGCAKHAYGLLGTPLGCSVVAWTLHDVTFKIVVRHLE